MRASSPVLRAVVACCAAAVLCRGGTGARASVSWSQEAGSTRALLIAADPAAARELGGVASVLERSYGADPDGIERLVGDQAKTDDIERKLVDLAMRAGPRDTVIVVLALAQHDKGQDRILITRDFDPARPWSGLSLDLLQKVSAGSSAGSFWNNVKRIWTVRARQHKEERRCATVKQHCLARSSSPSHVMCSLPPMPSLRECLRRMPPRATT